MIGAHSAETGSGPPARPDSYDERRDKLLDALLRWMVALGGIAYAPSLFACLADELYVLAAIDTVAYVVLAAIVFSPGTSYRMRLSAAVFTTLVLGAAVLFSTGTEGAGHLWLICSVFIAALFGRLRVVVRTIVLTQVAMLGYGVLSVVEVVDHDATLMSIIAISANLLVISIAMSFITYHLLRYLRAQMSTQEDTLRLLDHRVKNNLQCIESLVALSRVGGCDTDTLERRIRAISAANELLLSQPRKQEVDLGELLRVIADPTMVTIDGTAQRSIPAERIGEVAVGLSDLLEILRETAPIRIGLNHSLHISATLPIDDPSALRARIEQSLVPAQWLYLPSEDDPDSEVELELALDSGRDG